MNTLQQTIENLSIPEPNSGCWLWLGGIMSAGYGYIYHNKKLLLAHRLSYEASIGKIEGNLTIDHLCNNKLCVNPSHLAPVPRKQNTYRGASRRLFCKNGHLLTAENLIILSTRNEQRCRICHLERQLKYDRAKK